MKLSTVAATAAAASSLFASLLPGASARLTHRAGDNALAKIGTSRSVSRGGGGARGAAASAEDEKRALELEDTRA
jgi:hypothetical protein